MSYVAINMKTLIDACQKRIQWAKAKHELALLAVEEEYEQARNVWWRQLLGLPLLTREQGKERVMKACRESYFGGSLAEARHDYDWRVRLPNELLAACQLSFSDELLLSVEDANKVHGWLK